VAKALVEILGDADSFVASLHKSTRAVSSFKGDLRSLAVDVRASAERQVKASAMRTSRIREEMAAVRELAATYKRGSREQIAAMELVERKQRQLDRLTGSSSGSATRGRSGFGTEERRAGGILRGGVRGAGIGGVGLAAFAGGSFLASYVGISGVRTVIDAATQAKTIESQLAAQYRASGQALGDYRKQIDGTLSRE